MNSLWDILSVAIGISSIFMILSILNSWIQDYIATVFDLRAKKPGGHYAEPARTRYKGIRREQKGENGIQERTRRLPRSVPAMAPGWRAEAQNGGCEKAAPRSTGAAGSGGDA